MHHNLLTKAMASLLARAYIKYALQRMDPVREASLMDNNNTTSLSNAQQHWGIVTVSSSSVQVVVAKSEAAAFAPPWCRQ